MRRLHLWLIIVGVTACIAIGLGVWHFSRQALNSRQATPIPVVQTLNDVETFDAGEVLIGTQLTHSFKFKNEYSEPLLLDDDDAIERSCGCTEVKVAPHRLEVGGTAQVLVTIDTRDRQRDVDETVVVRWKRGSEQTATSRFRLRSRVLSALWASPPQIVADFRQGSTEKDFDLEIGADLQCHWDRATLVPWSDLIEVVERKVDSKLGRLRLRVRCNAPTEAIALGANLAVTVPCEPTARSPQTTELHLNVPIYVTPRDHFRIAPRLPFISRDENGTWNCTFTATGEAIARGRVLMAAQLHEQPANHETQVLSPSAVRIALRWPSSVDLPIRLGEKATVQLTWSDLGNQQIDVFRPAEVLGVSQAEIPDNSQIHHGEVIRPGDTVRCALARLHREWGLPDMARNACLSTVVAPSWTTDARHGTTTPVELCSSRRDFDVWTLRGVKSAIPDDRSTQRVDRPLATVGSTRQPRPPP